jgi:gas vesicle protein
MAAEPEELEREIARTREQVGRDVDALAEKVSPRAVARRRMDRVRSAARSARDNVMGTTSDTATSAGDKLTEWREEADDTMSTAKDSVAGAADTATRTIRRGAAGNPLAAGAVAFGVGWLVSSLFPTSRTEARLGSTVRETATQLGGAVREQAASAASDVADNLREPARRAANDVQQSVADAATTVRDEAKQHTANLTSEARYTGSR